MANRAHVAKTGHVQRHCHQRYVPVFFSQTRREWLIPFRRAEPFAEIQRLYPELIAVDGKGVTQPSRDLWLKEAQESIRLAGASRLDENVWVGFQLITALSMQR